MTASRGRIGPNAITRAIDAVEARFGPQAVQATLEAAGLARYADQPPGAMVDEAEVVRLHATLAALLGADEQAEIAAEAGRRTARYLLAHRIPAAAQRLLRALPRPAAMRLLRWMITRHAWTFAGSGRFAWALRPDPAIRLSGGPFALAEDAPRLLAPFYAASFEALLRELVDAGIRVAPATPAGGSEPVCMLRLTA